MIKDDWLNILLVMDGTVRDDHHGTLHASDVRAVLRKQVRLCSGDDITVRPVMKDGLSGVVRPSKTMAWFRACYEEVRKEVLKSIESGKCVLEGQSRVQSYSRTLRIYFPTKCRRLRRVQRWSCSRWT